MFLVFTTKGQSDGSSGVGAGLSTATMQDAQVNQIMQSMSAAISSLTSQPGGVAGIKSDDLLRLGMGIGMGLGLQSANTMGATSVGAGS